MIDYTTTSGNINIIDHEDGYYTVYLNQFEGTLTPSSDVSQLRIFVQGESTIQNDIELANHNKLDRIRIDGIAPCHLQSLKATSVEILRDSTIKSITGNVIRIDNCSVESIEPVETFLYAKGHIWLVDAYIESHGCSVFAHAPYVLIENLSADITATSSVFSLPDNVHIDFCESIEPTDVSTITTSFRATGLKCNEFGKPIKFIQYVKQTSEGTDIVDRRDLFSYTPAELASTFDRFKHDTKYTNTHLHRWMDQNGEILKKGIDVNAIRPEDVIRICQGLYDFADADINKHPIPQSVIDAVCNDPDYVIEDEVDFDPMALEVVRAILDGTYVWPRTNKYAYDEQDSRKYELGIYGLHSYRVTDICFHDEHSDVDELP